MFVSGFESAQAAQRNLICFDFDFIVKTALVSLYKNLMDLGKGTRPVRKRQWMTGAKEKKNGRLGWSLTW